MRIADYIDNEITPMISELNASLERVKEKNPEAFKKAFPVISENPILFYVAVKTGIEIVRNQMGNTPIIPEQIRSIDQNEFIERIFKEPNIC